MRAMLTLGLAAVVATPAAAQWLGEPVWNSPKGGTGVTIGIGTLTFTAGVARWKPDLATEAFTSIGGNAAFRLIGGSLLPFSVNLQVGAARTDSANSTPAQTAVTGAVGFSVPLPTPGISIEPYFSPGIRYHSSAGTNTTQFGYVFGANLSFGLVGLHLAYDNERLKGGRAPGLASPARHVAKAAPSEPLGIDWPARGSYRSSISAGTVRPGPHTVFPWR